MKRALVLIPGLLLLPALAQAQDAASTPTLAPIAVQAAPAPYAPPAMAPDYYNTAAMSPYASGRRARMPEIVYHGGSVPAGAHLETRHSGWLLAGGITFGSLYATSVLYALFSCPPGASAGSCASNTAWLYVPIVGPFVTAADPNASFGGRNLAIFDGVLQTAAATAMIVSLLTPHQVVVANGYASNETRTRRAQWSLMPGAAGATAGATLSVTHF